MLSAVKAAGVSFKEGTAAAVVGAEEVSAEADGALSVKEAVASGAEGVSATGGVPDRDEDVPVAGVDTDSSVSGEDTASLTVVFGSSEPQVVAKVTDAEVLPAGDSEDES